MDQDTPKTVPTGIASQETEAGNTPPAAPTTSGTGWLSTEVGSVLPEVTSSTIAVANKNAGVSKLFYLVFAIVLVIFIVMTTMLVKTLMREKSSLPVGGLPIATKAVVTAMPTLTPIPTAVVDPVVTQFGQLSTSDEIGDLEAEIKATDLSILDQSVATLDAQFGFTSPKN